MRKLFNNSKRKSKQIDKSVSYRFWNTGVEYMCNITAPVAIPNYRLKEVFDRNFVGKKDICQLTHGVHEFEKLSPSITYEIKPVKETQNV